MRITHVVSCVGGFPMSRKSGTYKSMGTLICSWLRSERLHTLARFSLLARQRHASQGQPASNHAVISNNGMNATERGEFSVVSTQGPLLPDLNI